MEWLYLGGVMLFLVMGSIASNGWDVVELRNREVWGWSMLLALTAFLMPNPYAGALLGTVVVGLWQIGRSWYVLRSTIIPIAGVAGSYALLAPVMKVWMIPYLLWSGAAVGMFLGSWAIVSLLIYKRPYRLTLPWKWPGMWGIYEDLGHEPFLCGQANRGHLLALSVLSQACCVGLGWIGHWWAGFALVLCYLPQHANSSIGPWKHPNVAHLGQLALGVSVCALVAPEVAGALAGVGLAAAGVLLWKASPVWIYPWRYPLDYPTEQKWWDWLRTKPGQVWVDSGRLSYWWDVLRYIWWRGGPKAWLFGFGTATWFAKTYRMGNARHPLVLTSAHNEFFQQLIEHGLVGLAIMLLYLGEALWRAAHGAPPQQAVFFLGAVWCAIALVHFPATFYHEFHPPDDTKEHWFGSPPLNAWTFVLALLAEAR